MPAVPIRFHKTLVSAALVGGALALGGCMSSWDAEPSVFIDGCMPDRADIVEQADWGNVLHTRVRIVDGQYRPMILYLEQGRPYSLVLENADPETHDFWAPAFLKTAVALDSIQIGDQAPAKGCVNGIRLKGRSTVTLRFVPVWEGRYEIDNVNFAFQPTIGPAAVANVVPPRIGTAEN